MCSSRCRPIAWPSVVTIRLRTRFSELNRSRPKCTRSTTGLTAVPIPFDASIAITGCTSRIAMCHCDCTRRVDTGDLVNLIVTSCVLPDGSASRDSPNWRDKLA